MNTRSVTRVRWGALAVEFNAPVNWPTFPRNWRPGPSWVPDPSWPPAPAGWSWWVVRRRRYVLGLVDRPVLRDWLFYFAVFGVLLVRPGIGSTNLDWSINGRPTAGDALWLKLALWGALLLGQVLVFLVIPGVLRRYVRHKTFQASPALEGDSWS